MSARRSADGRYHPARDRGVGHLTSMVRMIGSQDRNDAGPPPADVAFDVSGVVPTYNRRSRLRKVLVALDRQAAKSKEASEPPRAPSR